MGSTHVFEQLSFSMFLSILTFDFDLILGSFLSFWGPNGLFLLLGWALLIWNNDFGFLSFALYPPYHVVLSSCGGWFPAITYSQTNYSYGCYVVGVVVVVGL